MVSLFNTTTPAPERVPGVHLVAPAARADRPRVRMDVACFTGLAERGPVHTPVIVESWSQYQRRFGDPGEHWMMPDAVRLFFANGGRRCVVVRALDYARAAFARGQVAGISAMGRPLDVWARDPGRWGSALQVIFKVRRTPVSATLIESDVLMGTSSRVEVGTVLRMVRFDGAAKHVELFALAGVEGARWTLNQAPDARFVVGGELRAQIEELRLDVEIRCATGSERFSDLGLHASHRAWAPALLNQKSVLVRLEAALANASDTFLSPDLDARLDVVWKDAGSDAEETTGRSHFFDETGFNTTMPDDPYGGRPGIKAVLAEYDEGVVDQPGAGGHETEPITLVCMPDLMHPRLGAAPGDDGALPEDPQVTLRFDACTPSAAPEPTPAMKFGYPNLALDSAPGHGLTPLEAASRLVELCEKTDRLAILDLRPDADAEAVVRWHQTTRSLHAAIYAPWLEVAGPEGRRLLARNPCGAVCGIIARVEQASGMAGIPANQPVDGAYRPVQWKGFPGERFLFEERVNALRQGVEGIRIMGARTTGGDALSGQVNVQRILAYLRRQLPIDARWAVFEPNNRHLWRRLRQTVTRRLDALLNAGVLQGSEPSQAYFVRCDGDTHSLWQTDNGQVVVEVGVAPAVPMEFIEIRLVLTRDGATVEGR